MRDNVFDLFLDKAKSPDPHEQYVALMFALSLPSLCSRIEFPRTPANSGEDVNEVTTLYAGKNGSPLDKRLCIAWLSLHKHQFRSWWLGTMPYECLCDAVYELRKYLLNTGSLLECASKVVLVEPGCPMMYGGGRLYMCVSDFCQDMFTAALNTIKYGDDASPCASFEGLRAEVIPASLYDDIRQSTIDAYARFWEGRGRDLQLYQRYCQYAVQDIPKMRAQLKGRDRGFFGMSVEESARMLEVAEEVSTFEKTLGDELSRHYFSTIS